MLIIQVAFTSVKVALKLRDAGLESPCRWSYRSEIYMQQKIDNRIAVCSCIIVLSGMYVSYSECIDFEIRTAIKYGKPIIAVKPWGQQKIPNIITTYANEIIGWNSDSVVSAIRAYGLIG